jgi:uncharacterized protein
VDTEAANAYLGTHYPRYLFYSQQLDAALHAVPTSDIHQHYTPVSGLQALLQQPADDVVIADLQQLCRLLQLSAEQQVMLGVTGSLLLGLQNADSDIDLICYERSLFHELRERIKTLISSRHCSALAEQDWLEAYQRRNCELSLAEYIAHEARKYNKALIQQRKFDLGLFCPSSQGQTNRYHKLGAISITLPVSDDTYGFDYPAEFRVQHPTIRSVVSFTATYNGQAQSGEWIAVAGQLEEDEQGAQRIVVGSSREAAGEYIKVV